MGREPTQVVLLEDAAERAVNRLIAARMEIFHALSALNIVRERAVNEGAYSVVAFIDAAKPGGP